LSQIIENFTYYQKMNTFSVMDGKVSRGKYQEVLTGNPYGPINEYQHGVMSMISLCIDDDRRYHSNKKFLAIKQFSYETVSAYIYRFEGRKLQVKHLGLLRYDIITKKTLLDCFVKQIRDKVKEIYGGLPQGSHLSVVFFLVYINDIPVGDGDILFMDDCSIFNSGNTKLCSCLQARLDLLAG